MQPRAIILAGGQGSRLGPITAQRSKALITIGQRPHLIHQLLLLRDAGVDSVCVVVSPDTHLQVADAVHRSGIDRDMAIAYPVQHQPLGPANALLLGLEVLAGDGGVFMLMSDSFITEPLLRGDCRDNADWVGFAPAPSTRSFCYATQDDIYVDDIVATGEPVTVGVNYFASCDDAYNCAALVASSERARKFGEIPMSEFFNAYTDLRGSLAARTLETWQDIGDVDALAHAHRTRFISRSHHKLDLHESGVLRKYGEGEAFERQIKWMLEHQQHGVPTVANLTPRVYDAWWGGLDEWGNPMKSGYLMEYVDLPTLAELWLYWPGRPDVWQALLRNVLAQLSQNLWTGAPEDEPTANVLWFVDKTRDRLAMRGLPEWHAVAEPLLDEAEELLRAVSGKLVRGHGDLNFSNILYSLNTGMIKLIDPRGDHLVPWLYELAKLRYSYHGGFTAITHGLASIGKTVGAVELWPERHAEVDALDSVMKEYVDLELLTVCEGCLLIAGAPLHDGVESEVLFWRGVELLHGVFGD